jgi:hypothetical protein
MRFAFLALAVVCAAPAYLSAALPEEGGATIWDGVYTSAQAKRGASNFDTWCSSCHRAGFRGVTFMNRWREDKLSSLYGFISRNMPVGNPGVASSSEYIDIVAWILSLNEIPAGAQELTPAAAANIQVVGKNGPAPVPDGSLIEVVGCLVQNESNAWSLTHASEPVRTRDVDNTDGIDTRALSEKPLGTLTFGLPDANFYKPQNHRDHRVAVKGFLDRQPKGDRMLITAIATLASECGK